MKTISTIAALWALLTAATIEAATTPQQRCEAAKHKITGKYAACRENAEASLATTGDMAKYDAAIAKCETKYQITWQTAEQKALDGGGSCTTMGDETLVQDLADQFGDDVAQHLAGGEIAGCPEEPGTCAVGTAATGDVLNGKTFSSSAGVGAIGTMPNNGAASFTPGATAVVVPVGYYSGGQVNGDASLVTSNIRSGVTIFGVSGNSNVVDTSSGTAAAADLRSGTVAWVDGAAVNGTMPNNGAANFTPGATAVPVPAGYYSGGQINTDADLVAANIRTGVNVFGVVGSLAPASQSCGNNLSEGSEVCDGTDLNSKTCASEFPSTPYGTLACSPGCTALITSGCLPRFEAQNVNGNATVFDHQTGLEWVKTDDAGGITDKDNTYSYSAAIFDGAGVPDGTVFDNYLTGLNAMNYGGHNDWRLPGLVTNLLYWTTSREFETIVAPSGNPRIDQSVFGPTQGQPYWSLHGDPWSLEYALALNFGNGSLDERHKTNFHPARAVRGGF